MRQGLASPPLARREWCLLTRLALAASVAALSLASSASPASAAVTLGQFGPPNSSCPGPVASFDFVQTAVASGNSYTVPGTGTITSWSNNSGFDSGQTLTLAVFRKVADPNIYQQVGHDGPRPLQGGLVNTFPASIPVQPGDLLGSNPESSGTVACTFPGTAGDSVFAHSPGLADGQQTQFFVGPAERLNLTAVFDPSHTVALGSTKLNKKKGTATLNLTLPNPGELTASGNGVKASSLGHAVISKSVAAGPAQLLIKAKGKQARTLNATGKVKLKVTITYTPTNGSPGTQLVKVKLKKR